MNFNFFSLTKDGVAREGNMNFSEIIIASGERKENHQKRFLL